MLTDDKFYDAAKDLVFFKTSNGEIVRLEDYWNKNKEKNNGKIFYALETSSVYMDLLKSQGLEAILIDSRIDSHFIQFLESKNPDMKFQRADSELADGVVDREHSSSIVDSNNKTEADRIKEFFEKILKRDGLEIKAEPLKAEGVPAVVLLPEHLRRLSEMGMTGSQNLLDLLKNHTLVINTRSVLVKNILGMSSTKAGKLARTVYDMALLSSKIFGEAEFSEYLKRTTETLEELSAP
ncbi:hypothetical protein LEP1GSC133_3266 [Leptospira borgpetersenii serovar Pomona str. 200901868]|uniref:Uncharacterized protein n=1 Tax=Leptospira borgpetersenii serovar Pomona str. 200901868 TaxID=1192866 RepID=M6WI28_LEPBO|nr:hypothetical protein LEP1GSC133_3266 [Leptospira borgpetersenii serovar Pomona str. 200901868]